MHPGVHAKATPDKPAYVMAASGRAITYRELNREANRIAHLLARLGLGPGDGVVLAMENHPRFLQITWAAQRAGLYYTPVSTLFQGTEIHYIIENSGATVLFVSPAQHAKLDGSRLAGVTVIPTEPVPGIESTLDERLAHMPIDPIPMECEGSEMFYSSGTTGHPKGVRFPIEGAPLGTVTPLFEVRARLHRVTQGSVYLSTAPLYHSAPLRYNMMMTRFGATSVIMERFEPERARSLIETYRVTHSQWVPTMFHRLLQLPEDVRGASDLSSHRVAIHAAAPCPVATKERMMAWWGPILYEYYSGTEANGQTAIGPEEWITHRGSVGRPIFGELHIVGDAGDELAPGRVGTVYFSGGADFEYYKDPDKTAAAKNDLGWSTMGDMGYVDEEGYLYLTDRRSFMIISGGVNIYPQEVENLLIQHGAVADVAVFGVPNEEYGEEVKAVVETAPGIDASAGLADELIGYCRERLAHLKCPKTVDFIERLPRHPTGKLYKRQLRDPYWVDHDSAIV